MSSNWVWDYYNNNTKEKKGENRSQNAGSWVEDYYKYGKTDTSGVDDAYLDTFVSDATKFFGDVDAKKVSYTDAFSAIDDLSSRYDTVQAYLFQNRDQYGKDRYKQLSDAMGSIKSTFDSVGEYYSQWGDQEEYDEYMMGWLDEDFERTPEAVEQRKAKYQANAERIEQIENLIGGNIFERSFNTLFGPTFTDPNARDALYAEKEALIAENNRYEREQKALDDYYVPVTNEFLNNAGYRDYENATPEQFWEHDRNAGAAENALRQGGYRGEDGTVYDKNGNIVQSPVVVEDKLGLYLAESDKHYNPPGDNVGEYWRQIMLGTRGGWDQLTEHEINIYYDLYKREGQEAAYRYLDAMAPTLTKRQTEAMYEDIEKANGLELAFYNAASIPLNILGGAHAFVTDSIKLAAGEEYNPYSEDHRMQNAASYIRETTAGRIDEATGGLTIPVIDFSAGDAYQALMSGADSLVGSAIGGTAYGVLMGMGSASSTATDLYNKGATTEQIIYGSLLAGAAEMVFEKFSIDQLVKTKDAKSIRDIIVNMLKQGGVEASEEMATEIANTITNVAVMGSQSDWVDINTFIKNVVNAGLGGFISGGGMGGIHSVGQKLMNDAADREVNKLFKNAYDGQEQRKLVAEGLELDPQSAYFKRLEQKLGKGKELTGSEIRGAVTRNERIGKQQTEATGGAEVAEQEQDTAEEAAEQTAQNAPKIAQERSEVTAEQTVAKTENKADAESVTAEATPANENVQEQLAQASKGYGAQAKAMVATYLDGQDVAEYDAAFRQVYDMGASRISYSYVEGTKSYLTDSQKKIAYEAGKASQDAKATERERELAKQATGGTKRKKGVVRGQGVSLEELSGKFNDTQRQAYKILSTIAEITGIDIVLYKSEIDAKGNFEGAQGMYKAKDDPGTLYIDINAGLNNIKSAGDLANYTMLRTFSHEFVHFIENYNPVWYNELRRVVFDHIENADELISREAAATGKDYEYASREVVAEALTDILPDSSFLEDLANNHKNIFEKLYAKFKEFVANIKKHFASLSPNANKATQTLKEGGKYIESVLEVFNKAALGAVENYQATVAEQKVEVEETAKISKEKPKKAKKPKKIASTEADFSNAMESVVNDDANHVPSEEIITDGITVTDGNGTQYSRRSMKADIAEGQMFEDLKTYCGWTQEKVDGLKKQLEDLVAYMAPYSDIIDMNETYGREGRRYSPYKPNSDPLYTISMDFSTLCSKRLLTQYVIENLQLRENRPMSAEEQMAIRDMLKEYRKVEKGLQVACVMCYVEAARLKSPKQIQKWLDDPATAMRNYFADKNPEFSAYIKKAQEDFKESKGYDRNATKKEMSPKDVSALNKIRPKVRAEYQPSEEEMAIIETAKSLPHGTYLTAGNLADLSEKHPEIYKAYTAFIRTATRSKSLETDEPYYYGDSRRDNGNGIIVSDSFIEAVNRENGMRFSSWSDWRIQHMLDFITAVIDLSVRRAAMHGYTKFADEVRVLGKTGMMFNLSGVAGTQTGLNEDGTLNFSDTESINIDEAITLREEFPETAGLQCIGVSKEHILALLRSDVIDYVIPYHTSGLNATLRQMGDIYGWMDFTSTQHALEDKSIKKESAIDQENWHTEPVFSEFFVGYDTGLDGVEAMRKSADNYIRMCKERGLIPKFNEFANEPGYWKLLIDRKMVNQKTNTLIQQKPVTPEFDFDVIKGIVDKYVKGYDSGLESRALDYIVRNWDSVPARIRDLKKQGSAKAKTTKKAIDQLANETLAAQPTDVQYSRRQQTDKAYMDAVESGDMETAQRMVDEAAKEAGYDVTTYHGTEAEFTVFKTLYRNEFGYHVGTKSAAEDRVQYGLNSKVLKLYTSLGKTIRTPDVFGYFAGMHDYIFFVRGELDKVSDMDFLKQNKRTKKHGNKFPHNDLLDTLHNAYVEFVESGYKGSKANAVVETTQSYLKSIGVDSIAYTNAYEAVGSTSYLLMRSNQVKSADPVTYDDDGNVIPLSERFDEAQEDIRYQRRANYASGLTSGKPGEGMSYEVSVKDYTLKEVANMYHLGNLGAEYDALFDKVYAVCENMGITFDVVPIIRNDQGKEVPGVNTGDRVSFNFRSFNSTKVDNEYKSKVILHEMLHAATKYAINAYARKRKGDATVKIPKDIYESCVQIDWVYNAIKDKPVFKKKYGLKNRSEMVAELSNPEFVDLLKETYPSLWHKLLDTICEMIGINKHFTNYDKLKKAVDEIIAHPDFQLAQGYYNKVAEKNAYYLDESQYSDADVQEQRRDGRMTDQEVLAYAVDMYESDPSSMALSDAEKNAFELFKQRLAKLDGLIAERAEQGRIYRENTFQKGGDRELAQKAHNRMEVLDGQIERASAQLLSVKEKTVLQGVLQKARKVVEQQERARGDEKLKRWRERRQEAASIKKYRDRILADREELINWLNHPLNKDATKHINDNVKAAVIQFLLTIDTSSKQKLSGRGATKADEKHVKQARKLMEMLNGLDDEVRYSGDYDLPLNFNDRLQRHIKAVEDLLESYDGDTVLNIMTVDELQDLSVLTANLKTALTTLNKFHTNAMFAHVSTAGDNTVRYLRKMGDSDGSIGENFLMWKNIRPAYVWERFGDGGISIEQALRRGQSKLAWNAKEIIDYAKATFTKEERKDWEEGAVTVSLSGDREIRVTVAALMSFYELSKREQGRAHILSGGVTVSDVEIRENKKKRRIKGRYGKFTEADIDAMNAVLTDHQKEVADKLQQFMEKQGGEWGNHVTLARFGEKAFGEKGYFPISVDKQSLSTNNDKNVKGADLYRLLNMGFTKELSSNTSQPVVLYSIFDVFSTHMADMAQYNAMALPVLDAIRWLNYKHFEFEGDERVEKSNLRAELRRVYGAPVSKGGEVLSGYAESFIAHILQAYNGTEAQGTPGDSLGMQMLHTYNRAQIAFNMRVVVQQPMAITRATIIIDPKYITQALNPKLIKQNVDDMLAHSGIAVWKDLGYYDINISRGLTQMIKQESTFSEKVTEVGLKPAEFADKATWAVLWGACKLQLKAQGVTDYAEIEKLFDEVIYKTQVVDSVLTKSQYMRDKGFFARSTASFMSEPTTTASMLLGEFDAYRADIRRGLTARQAWDNHKKTIGKTVLVYSVSAILLSMVTAAADAWRDDDDYQNIAEKWNEAFWQNLLDEISPFNKLPLINNVWELGKVALDTFTNLDVYGNLPDAAWAQWADTLSKAWSITQELIEGESNYTWYAAIYKYLQVASGLSGLPISAGTREVVTFWNNVIGTFAPSLKIKDYELKPMTEIKYAVLDGYLTADEAADELYDQGLVYDRKEAELTAELWDFLKDHKEYSDVSVSAYAKYKENCEGIDFGYFYQAWKYYSQTDADRGKDGEPISGSKKRKVLDFIYQMRLTPAQKKQLIKCFYK